MKRSLLRFLSGVALLAIPFALAAQVNMPEGLSAESAKANVLTESPNGLYIIQMICLLYTSDAADED